VCERDRYLHGPAPVIEADPAEVGRSAFAEVVMVFGWVFVVQLAMAGPA
jgi:hypothetical protein